MIPGLRRLNLPSKRHTWRSLQSLRAGEHILDNTSSPQQLSKTLASEFQEPALNGPDSSPFPYRSSTWKLEQPSARDMQERLAVATIAADIGIWDLDVASDSLQWCHRCAKIFGTSLEPGRWKESVFERIHVTDRRVVQSAIDAALDPGGTGVFDSEYRITRPNGETRWIASNGKTFFEQVKGVRTPIRFLGTMLDRTDHKLAHEALIESENWP